MHVCHHGNAVLWFKKGYWFSPATMCSVCTVHLSVSLIAKFMFMENKEKHKVKLNVMLISQFGQKLTWAIRLMTCDFVWSVERLSVVPAFIIAAQRCCDQMRWIHPTPRLPFYFFALLFAARPSDLTEPPARWTIQSTPRTRTLCIQGGVGVMGPCNQPASSLKIMWPQRIQGQGFRCRQLLVVCCAIFS